MWNQGVDKSGFYWWWQPHVELNYTYIDKLGGEYFVRDHEGGVSRAKILSGPHKTFQAAVTAYFILYE